MSKGLLNQSKELVKNTFQLNSAKRDLNILLLKVNGTFVEPSGDSITGNISSLEHLSHFRAGGEKLKDSVLRNITESNINLEKYIESINSIVNDLQVLLTCANEGAGQKE